LAKKSAKTKKGDAGPLVVGSKVKAHIKGQGGKTSSDVLEALNAKVCSLLNAAVARAKSNKRTTVRAADL
jgi:histone H3/H4